jgi:serine/threonine protein kinase
MIVFARRSSPTRPKSERARFTSGSPRRVALKRLHPELSSHDEWRARFLREAYATSTIDHPGITRERCKTVTLTFRGRGGM